MQISCVTCWFWNWGGVAHLLWTYHLRTTGPESSFLPPLSMHKVQLVVPHQNWPLNLAQSSIIGIIQKVGTSQTVLFTSSPFSRFWFENEARNWKGRSFGCFLKVSLSNCRIYTIYAFSLDGNRERIYTKYQGSKWYDFEVWVWRIRRVFGLFWQLSHHMSKFSWFSEKPKPSFCDVSWLWSDDDVTVRDVNPFRIIKQEIECV